MEMDLVGNISVSMSKINERFRAYDQGICRQAVGVRTSVLVRHSELYMITARPGE